MTPQEMGLIYGSAMLGAVFTGATLVRLWVFAKNLVR